MNELIANVTASMKMIEGMSLMWGHVWLDGTPMSSLKYACSESGEAIDAEIRLERSADSRNNEKQLSVEAELTDVWMMMTKFLFNVQKDSGMTIDQFIDRLNLSYYDKLSGSLASVMLDVSGLTVIMESVLEEMGEVTGTISLGIEISIVLSRLMNKITSYNVDVVDELAKTLTKIEEKQYAKGYEPR